MTNRPRRKGLPAGPSCTTLLRLACLLLAGAFGGALACRPAAAPPGTLNGKFSVLVRPVDRRAEPVPVEEAGALPARTGGAMCLEAQLEKPAFVYLIWIDASGKARPLYPWNNESIEVTDFDQPPPVRRATNRVFSPMLGRDWPLDGPPGLESVLLLARATALPENVKLSEHFAYLAAPPAPSRPDELIALAVEQGGDGLRVTGEPAAGGAAAPAAADPAFQEMLLRLAPHFDLVRAVRFAHEDAP